MDYSMKLKGVGILLLLLLPMLCSAQTDVLPSDTVTAAETTQRPISIGYLSYDSALVAMPDNALVQAKMKELREAYDAELKLAEDEFNRKYEDFLDGQRDFPRTILLKRQTELQEMLQKNIAFKQQCQQDMRKAKAEAMAPLRAKLNAVIAQVAKEKGLTLVVNTDSNACPFIDPETGIAIQEEVISLLNSSDAEKN